MNVISLLLNSVSKAALNDTLQPGILVPWIAELQDYVDTNGKFQKSQVGYLPFSPPPVFWDYKCRKCRFWQDPDACSMVEGTISPRGWCAIWLPPDDYKSLTWPRELLSGNW